MPAALPGWPMPTGLANWRDKIYDWRDRLIGDRHFQRWASALPIGRHIANRQARALFDLVAGFVYAQVLLACVELRLFDRLAGAPQTAAVLAPRLGLPLEATQRLLDAATALDLVGRRSGGRYGLGPLGAALRANPGVIAMVEHHRLLYADLADPVALLRGEAAATGMAAHWPYAREGSAAGLATADVGPYTALMAASQAFIADEVLAAYDLGRHRRLLDIGGGDGSFLRAAAARAPHLDLVLFDLPAVAALAKTALRQTPETAGTTVIGGDFLRDPLPDGADLITLVRVLHDQDDERALALLRAIRRALPPAGTLLIAEPLADTKGAEPVGAYFAFYLLAMGRGRPRRRDEIEEMLRASGFSLGERVSTRMPLLAQLVIARPSTDQRQKL